MFNNYSNDRIYINTDAYSHSHAHIHTHAHTDAKKIGAKNGAS